MKIDSHPYLVMIDKFFERLTGNAAPYLWGAAAGGTVVVGLPVQVPVMIVGALDMVKSIGILADRCTITLAGPWDATLGNT